MVPVYFHLFRPFSDLMLIIIRGLSPIDTNFHAWKSAFEEISLKKEKEPDGKKEAGLKNVYHFRRTFISLWNK